MIGFDCRSLLRRKTANRLTRSTSEVTLALLLAKLNEIALPMAELLSLCDSITTVKDVEFRAEAATVTPSSMPRSASRTTLRQVPPQLDRLTVRGIGELHRLITDANRMALEPHAADDLLWRPAMHDALDHRLAHMGEPGELAQLGSALTRHLVGGDTVVALSSGICGSSKALRLSSRKIVERCRPSFSAMTVALRPAARQRAILRRSSMSICEQVCVS